MIRPATLDDMPALLEMGARFHAMSPWSVIPVDESALTASLTALIGSDKAAVFVTNELKGMIGVVLAPVFFASVIIAQEMFWYSEKPGCGALLRQTIEQWSKDQGAHSLGIARLVGLDDDRLDAMYKRKAYQPGEVFYYKVL